MKIPVFKQVVLLILDGFGVATDSSGNAVLQANPVNLNKLINNYPATTLQASGPTVGLPWGERGNSEVGHLNIGAGRIVSEDLPRITKAITSGAFFENPSFLAAMNHTKKNNSALHLVGLVSVGDVHSTEEHLFALLGMAAEQGLGKVFIHMFTDGRDTPPKSALGSLDRLTRKILEHGIGKVATLTGRFFAMDRGGHFELTERTYRALVSGEGEQASSAAEAISGNYARQIYDEVIPPTVITEKSGQPVGRISEGDAVIFFNFRPDRMTQLARALIDPNFDKFSPKQPYLQNMHYVTMTMYDKTLGASVAFPPIEIHNTLAEVLSKQNLSQFHLAESEKYAHVTSFFNGGIEAPWPGEEREIITSPASYQKRYEDVPEMSVAVLRQRVVEKLKSGTAFILVNFANTDVVGHTGNRAACIKAVKAVDESIGVIQKAADEVDACLVITADHGNIEEILDPRFGGVNKEHSANPVPFIVIAKPLKLATPRNGGYLELAKIVPEGVLSDIAPTILALYGIPKPPEMSAISLLPLLAKQVE